MTKETDRQEATAQLLIHTADRAIATAKEVATMQDVLHDQQQLIANLQQQLEALQGMAH